MWDLYPTFCDAANATPPAGLDGISFLPTLLGQGRQRPHAHLYWEFYEQGGSQAVRQGRWKAAHRNMTEQHHRVRRPAGVVPNSVSR